MIALDSIYIVANTLALAGWSALFVCAASGMKVSWRIGRLVAIGLAILYAVLIFNLLPFQGGGFDSLDNLTRLFAQPEIALVGWVHYLAFDLFIGSWQLQTAERENMRGFVLLPSLFLTMVFGPVGLLFFLLVRRLGFQTQYSKRHSVGQV